MAKKPKPEPPPDPLQVLLLRHFHLTTRLLFALYFRGPPNRPAQDTDLATKVFVEAALKPELEQLITDTTEFLESLT